jgi:hypothetical protein
VTEHPSGDVGDDAQHEQNKEGTEQGMGKFNQSIRIGNLVAHKVSFGDGQHAGEGHVEDDGRGFPTDDWADDDYPTEGNVEFGSGGVSRG